MARYFFDVRRGDDLTRDQAGAVCRNDHYALRHAWATLPALASEADRALSWQRFELLVRREDDVQIGQLGITIELETLKPAAQAILDAKDQTKPLYD